MSSAHSKTDFRHSAACRDEDPELWFPVAETHLHQPPSPGELAAIAVCHSCSVRTSCLTWAVDAGEVQWGVLGGLRAAERAALRRTSREVAA